jgi:hypothetical protein
MTPYRTTITVVDPNEIILRNVPVQVGEQVEVVVRSCDTQRQERVRQLQKLMQETQALPQLKNLTEEELQAEIASYRNGS